MENSPLARLPAEIRNDIYQLVLTQPSQILCYYNGTKAFSKEREWEKNTVTKTLAITSTCQQIRQECGDLFLECNTLHITRDVEGASAVLSQLLPGLHGLKHSSIRFEIQPVPDHLDGEKWYQRGDTYDGTIERHRALLFALSRGLHELCIKKPDMELSLQCNMNDLVGEPISQHLYVFFRRNPIRSMSDALGVLRRTAEDDTIDCHSMYALKSELLRWRKEGFIHAPEGDTPSRQ